MREKDKSLNEVYFFWMDRAMKAQRKAKNRFFKKLGVDLTSDQWIILKRLSEVENQTQKELADAVSKDPASITRSLDILEKNGMIERRSADRRSFMVLLTKQGQGLVDKVIPEAVIYRQKGISGLSEKDMKTFKKVLDTIYINFSRE
ncbi:MarR family winged helix-turn-helix transcriptional regulator [Ekhidna sp.]